MKAIPNCITFSRIIFSLILIFFKPLSVAFYIIYLICGFSDMIDGFIARKLGATSRFGEKLDSVADLIMIGILLIMLYPIVNPSTEIIIWIIFIGIIRLASAVVAFRKYETFSFLHTYGNKITGLVLFIFPMFLPFTQTTVLMYIVCVIASISAIEELIIQMTSRQLHVNRQSIFTK